MTDHRAPWVTYVRFYPRDRMAAMLGAIIFSFAGVPLVLASYLTSDWTPLLVGAVLLVIVSLFALLFVLRTRQRRTLKHRLRSVPRSRVERRRIVEALVNLRRFEDRFNVVRRFPWNHARAQSALHGHGLAESLCVIDARLRRAIRRVPVIDELLEAEEVGESMQQAGSWIMLLAGLASLASAALMAQIGGGWVCGAVAFFMIAFGLIASAVHRWMVAGRGSLARMRGIVVGMGFVTDHRHLWIATRCITVLRYENGKIHLTIFNEHGQIRLVYLLTPLTSFSAFWQRWMHPRPRPELAADLLREGAGH